MTNLAIQYLREFPASTSSAPANINICRLKLSAYPIFQQAQTVPAYWAAQTKIAKVIG